MKQALRRLGRDKWFTAVSILVLALGIGAVTAVFSIVNGVLLQPLSYRDPQRLCVVHERASRVAAQYPQIPVSARHFYEWTRSCASCEQMALAQPASMNLTGDGEPERIGAVRATADLLPLLGAGFRLGRGFHAEEDQAGGPLVAVISHSLWQRRFTGSPDAIGRGLRLDDVTYRVIGVLSPDFRFPKRKQINALIGFPERAEVFIPAAIDYAKARPMGQFNYAALIRLKPGATPRRAAEEMTAPLAALGREFGVDESALVTPLAEMVTGNSGRALWMLLATVGAVLLIVCVNLGNLMLVRAHGRMRESAIRCALGARGRQVWGPILGESAILAAGGGALGVLAAWIGLDALIAAAPIDLPRLEEVRLDGMTLAFAIVTASTCALLFGLLPAIRLSRTDPQETLKTTSLNTTDGRSRLRARNVLVAIETALSAALLIVAGLFGASFSRLMRAERGFDVQNVLTADMALPQKRYPDAGQRARFQKAAIERLAQIPGVRSAGITNSLPLRGESWVDSVRPQGSVVSVWELPLANFRFVNPAYFDAIGTPLRAGRLFAENDRGRKVAVISEAAARRVWPGESAIGKRYGSGGDLRPKSEDLVEIVGVVADVRTAGLEKAPVPVIYTPYWQDPVANGTLVIRTAMEPLETARALRAAIRELDAELPLARLSSMEQILAESVGQRQFQATLAGAFSLAALLLACLGIYGVVSYTVARRTPEMGIRMAFGAGRGAVSWLVARQEMAPVAIGLAAGIAIALGGGKWFGSMLYGISPRDPATIAAVSAILLAASGLACWAPARRAARTDVMRALRYE
jgi:putative ABC transport system permease protein